MNDEAPTAATPGARAVRVWDLPTRVFHWTLAVAVVFSVVSARVGGGAMVWHMRSGHLIFALLAFRLLWGFLGGHWSRFAAFAYLPQTSWRYLRGQSLAGEHHEVGHSPIGAWSVFALLAVLVVQVATGLVADDEIASSGPLYQAVSNATSREATSWHKGWGQWLVVSLAVVHLLAIAFYALVRRRELVGPMLHGDKPLAVDVPASIDTARTRGVAAALFGACALLATWVASLGA